jgi:hypothetical protein
LARFSINSGDIKKEACGEEASSRSKVLMEAVGGPLLLLQQRHGSDIVYCRILLEEKKSGGGAVLTVLFLSRSLTRGSRRIGRD